MTVEIFNGLKGGSRLVIGNRTIVATGKPKCIGACKPRGVSLGDLRWDAPLHSATIIVGQDKGKEDRNKVGRCRTLPGKFSAAQVDRWFQKLRQSQVGKTAVGATRITGKGWYKGKQEKSASYQVIHDPSVPGEEGIADFRARMQSLAEDLAEHFCQAPPRKRVAKKRTAKKRVAKKRVAKR